MNALMRRGGAVMVAVFAAALWIGYAAAEDADASRMGDGTGSVMTFDDLDEVSPHLEVSRSPRIPAVPLPTAADLPSEYYYYDEDGNLVRYLNGRHSIMEQGAYFDPGLGQMGIAGSPRVLTGPGQVVLLSPHDSWPEHDSGNSGYWDKGHTITGDPAYMSYYERNYGWGLGSSWYAGPRHDRSRIPSAPAPRRAGPPAGTNFQQRFPGRLPARTDSADPMERREARREFSRSLNNRGQSGAPGVARPRPPGSEGRRLGR